MSWTSKAKLPDNGAPAVAKKNAPDGVTGALTELQVWSIPAINRGLLICHAPEDDGGNPMNLVSVLVRDNTNFLKKMRLTARRVNDQKFILEGPCPRARGRW